MFFITALDFWIARLEEHMQKVIAENSTNTTSVKSSKVQPNTEVSILEFFKISNENMFGSTKEKLNGSEKIEFSPFKMRYGDKKIQFDLLWKDVVLGQYDFLYKKIDDFFNPQSTTINLTQFKLLLVFRLQQKCLELRETAYLGLLQRDELKKSIRKQEKSIAAEKLEAEKKEKAVEKKPEEIKSEGIKEEDQTKVIIALQDEGSNKNILDEKKDPILILQENFEKLKISNDICYDESLLKDILKSIEEIRVLMQKLEEKGATKLNQFTYTPSDGRTGELLYTFSKTMEEIFGFFSELDKTSAFLPGHNHALLDCSPKKVFKKNDPLLIVYEDMVSYLLSNYSRSANFERLSESTAQSGIVLSVASTLIGLVTQPTKTLSDKLTIWTYNPETADDKRQLLSDTIIALRKSLKDQPILDNQKRPNESVWDNCERTLAVHSEEAYKNQGYSIWPQQLTVFFDKTREDLKDTRALLRQQSQPQSHSPNSKKALNTRK